MAPYVFAMTKALCRRHATDALVGFLQELEQGQPEYTLAVEKCGRLTAKCSS